MASIDEEILNDQQENLRELAYIRNRLPQELKDKFSDEAMLWMLDTIVSYYYDSGVLESDDEEVAIDLESVADYVCSAAESERGEKIDRGDVFFIVEADLDFQEENA